MRGFFEIPPFFVDGRSDFNSSFTNVTIDESNGGILNNPGVGLIDLDTDGTSEGLKGRGILFMGKMDQGEYAVGELSDNGTLSGTAPDRQLVLNFVEGANRWKRLNRDGFAWSPLFDIYRVGILESYTYYVSPDFMLRRRRTGDDGSRKYSDEPVAVNIGNLQVELGVDTDNDNLVDIWRTSPGAGTLVGDRVLAMRVTVFGRTGREVPDWLEPIATFQNADGSTIADLNVNTINRFAKWRRIQVEAALRNYLF
jgi:hypothetical protein